MRAFLQSERKEKMVFLLLLAYPSLILTVGGGMNTVFILSLLLSLLFLPSRKLHEGSVFGKRDLWLFAMAMSGLLVATFISQSYWLNYSAHEYDAISRYWLAIPIFIWFSSLRPYTFTALQYAFPVAAIVGFFISSPAYGGAGRATSAVLDPIHFGGLELLLGFLSLLTINWFGRDHKILILLKCAGFLAGVGASVASGSRGGWLAIPVLLLLMLYIYRRHLSWKRLSALILVIFASAVLMYEQHDFFKQRLDELTSEIQISRPEDQAGNLDTSFGVRLQLYHAAIMIFLDNPFVGAGPQGFALQMQPMQAAGIITPMAAAMGRGEVHNDILSKAAGMGLPGLIAILALYAVPFRLFWKVSNSRFREVRRAGLLGSTFVSAIAIFGLTVEFLNLTMAAAFYAFTVAVLLAASNAFSREAMKSKFNEKEEL